MAKKIICVAAVFAVMLSGSGLGPIEPVAEAGHLEAPSVRGLEVLIPRAELAPCRITGLDHKIEGAMYDLPGSDWIRVWFKGKERNPFALFDTRDEMVYYDADRDGHFDGRAAQGIDPVGNHWCDLLDNILRGRVKAVRP